MDIKKIHAILGWSITINIGLGVLTMFSMSSKDWMYEIHSNFFTVSFETYSALWFMILGVWSILVWVFNIIPYIAIVIVDKKKGDISAPL